MNVMKAVIMFEIVILCLVPMAYSETPNARKAGDVLSSYKWIDGISVTVFAEYSFDEQKKERYVDEYKAIIEKYGKKIMSYTDIRIYSAIPVGDFPRKGWQSLFISNWGGGNCAGYGWVVLVKPPQAPLLFYFIDNAFPMDYGKPEDIKDINGDSIKEVALPFGTWSSCTGMVYFHRLGLFDPKTFKWRYDRIGEGKSFYEKSLSRLHREIDEEIVRQRKEAGQGGNAQEEKGREEGISAYAFEMAFCGYMIGRSTEEIRSDLLKRHKFSASSIDCLNAAVSDAREQVNDKMPFPIYRIIRPAKFGIYVDKSDYAE